VNHSDLFLLVIAQLKEKGMCDWSDIINVELWLMDVLNGCYG